jgi:hypothetical protein
MCTTTMMINKIKYFTDDRAHLTATDKKYIKELADYLLTNNRTSAEISTPLQRISITESMGSYLIHQTITKSDGWGHKSRKSYSFTLNPVSK